jgi:hypothetical protein
MSELPGTAAVGIETVEWLAESGGNLTVRITGRWRRRRPVTSGPPTLVIEAEGRRHRYPAMPEPPSLAGTGPGVWRLSFTVPGWLAPDLGRTWLQFGTVIVPLPVAVPAPGEGRPDQLDDSPAGSPPPPVRPAEPEAGRPPRAELPEPPTLEPGPERDSPARPSDAAPAPTPAYGPEVAELASRVAALERELDDTRAGRDELAASLADRDRSRRIAEQRAHAEQALRQDLARQLSVSVREAERTRQAMGELAGAEERIRALERELVEARRRSDEAEQVAAAAAVARERAERNHHSPGRALPHGGEPAAAETARLRFEQQLRGRNAERAVWIPAEPSAASPYAARAPSPPPAPNPRPVPAPPVPGPPVPSPAASSVPPPVWPPAAEPPPAEPPAEPLPAPAASGRAAPGGDELIRMLRHELDARTRADAAIRVRLIDAEARLAARVLLERRTTAALAGLRVELETLRDGLARERALRADAERRAGELERELSGQRALSRGAYDAIGELRGELDRLATPQPAPQGVAETPAPRPGTSSEAPAGPGRIAPSGPAGNERRAQRPGVSAATAASVVTTASAATTASASPDVPRRSSGPAAGAVVEPARLNDALSRLRETIAPQDAPDPATGTAVERRPSLHEALGRPSLERPFRKLVRADASAAGRLLLELLPLQHVVYPHAVAYDLVLGTGTGPTHPCVCVTVADGTVTIAVQSTPRPREAVDFQVSGEPARIARLLTAGRFRRRFGRRVARVRGRRDGVAALAALLGTPLDLTALHRAGVRLDPATAFALVASMIDPAWTVRERFTLAHIEPQSATTYVIVRDGRPIEVTRTAPEGRINTTVFCKADQLIAVLSGQPVGGLTVTGDEGPLALLREWIKHAQSE